MSETITVARPYAKAIFAYALKANQLGLWSTVLNKLSQVVLDPKAIQFISDPSNTSEQKSQLLLSILESDLKGKDDSNAVEHLISLLAENKRLLIMPDIFALYEALRAEQEKTLTVEVISFSPLNTEQQTKLTQTLSERLQRQVSLDVQIDQSLIGGAIIRAGDLVIDGSVREQLNKLRSQIAA